MKEIGSKNFQVQNLLLSLGVPFEIRSKIFKMRFFGSLSKIIFSVFTICVPLVSIC